MDEPQSPRVTALIVSRNDAAGLRRCLEQLEHSADRGRVEVLVVDDGSEDDTHAVPSEFPAVVALRIPRRVGWTRAVNIALRTAKGDLVLLLPQTALVQPDTISRLADRLETDASIGAVCPAVAQVWSFPSAADLASAWKTGILPAARPAAPGETAVDYPRGAPILVRRELLRAMNYLDARFGNAWSDLEMCWRIRSGGKKIVVLADVPVGFDPPASPATDVEWMDSAHGVATWIGLHSGFAAGLKFRLAAALHAFGRGKLSVATGILSGSKIDGNQAG